MALRILRVWVAMTLMTSGVASELRRAVTCVGVRLGCWDKRTAAAPATCGEDIEVPLA